MKIISVLLMCLLLNVVNAQETQELRPDKGYTHQQLLDLYPKFDKSTWNSLEDLDFTRFAYLNTSLFFTQAIIKRNGPVSELGLKPDIEIGNVKATTEFGQMTLDEWTEDHLDAVIIVKDGKIIYEKYPRMREEDKHLWWSVSKSVAGTVVGLLEEKGLIDVNNPVEMYIQEFKGTDWEGIPVIDILDMSSGMTGLEADDPEAYTNPDSPYGQYESSLGMQPTTSNTMNSTYDYVTTLKRQKVSGQKFEYTSVNTFVLSWIAEAVTNKPYSQLVSELFWQKMGAEFDATLIMSPSGAPASHGAISSTLRDLARYGMLFTPSWNISADSKVISDDLIHLIQTTGRPSIYKTGLISPQINQYMGEEVFAETRQWDFVLDDGDFGKSGYHGQTLYISPSQDLVIASFATGKHYDTWAFAREIAKSYKE